MADAPANPSHFERLRAISRYAAVDLRYPSYKVLVAYEACADFNTGEAYPSVAKVSKWTKEKNLKRVRQNIAATVAAGWLLEVTKGGAGRGNAYVYRVTIPQWVTAAMERDRADEEGAQKGTPHVPVSPPKKGTPHVPISTTQKGTSADAKGYVPENKRVRFSAQKGTPHVPPTYEQSETPPPKGAVAGGGCNLKKEIDEGVMEFLQSLTTKPKGLMMHPGVIEAALAHDWKRDELERLWKQVVNNSKEGDPRGWRFFEAMKLGTKPRRGAGGHEDEFNGKPLTEEEKRQWGQAADDVARMNAEEELRKQLATLDPESALRFVQIYHGKVQHELNPREEKIWPLWKAREDAKNPSKMGETASIGQALSPTTSYRGPTLEQQTAALKKQAERDAKLQARFAAARTANPNWRIGDPLPPEILEGGR